MSMKMHTALFYLTFLLFTILGQCEAESNITDNTCRYAIKEYPGLFEKHFDAFDELRQCILVFEDHNLSRTEFNITADDGLKIDVFSSTNEASLLYYHHEGGSENVVATKYCTFVITVPPARQTRSVSISYKPTLKGFTPNQSLEHNPTYRCSHSYLYGFGSETLMGSGQTNVSCHLCFSPNTETTLWWSITGIQNNSATVYHTVDRLHFTEHGTMFSRSTNSNGNISFYLQCLYVSIKNGPYAGDIVFHYEYAETNSSHVTAETNSSHVTTPFRE